MLLVEDEALA